MATYSLRAAKLNLQRKLSKISPFLKREIWTIRLKDLPRWKSAIVRTLRVIVLSVRGFNEDKVVLRASALTYFSLLSIVPVVAMAFGIAKGFGLDKMLEKILRNNLSNQKEVLDWIMKFSKKMLDTTKGGFIAGIGLALLVYSVMRLLANIEEAFNDIWEVRKQRTLSRKFTDYMAIMIIAPVLVILASSLTVWIQSYIKGAAHQLEVLRMFSSYILFFLQLLPYTLIWILFTVTYMIMPNTKVNFKAAMIAGIVVGTVYQIVQWGYIKFQIGISQYNTVYGSFAALPLFLVWIQLSWLIILMGAEFAFSLQNVEGYEFKDVSFRISQSFKKLLGLYITHRLIKDFCSGLPGKTIKELSKELDIPPHFVKKILDELNIAHVVSKIKKPDIDEYAFQPAQDVEKLSIYFVMQALDKKGIDNIKITSTPELEQFENILHNLHADIDSNPHNKLLKEI